jgi:CubicO group peptidase (beta-lactamase class C family)
MATLSAGLASAQTAGPTGLSVSSMSSFDRLIPQLMAKWQIPGAAVGVTYQGRLVFARGYGLADAELNLPVQPNSLFRIASISKPITAVAILKLVDEGRLDIDAKAFSLLDYLKPPPGTTPDPRTAQITVRHLLEHAAGWDRNKTFDPTGSVRWLRAAAQALGAPEPASCETIIRFMLGRPLDFSPGTGYAYSNLGYCVLGRIVEKVTGQSYEAYVKSQVLQPIGISHMQVGHTFLKDRALGEVRYYAYPGASLCSSVFPGMPGSVPCFYGSWSQEFADSYAGWIASVVDLLRFVTALDGTRSPAVLRPETLLLMLSRPAIPQWADSPNFYYALGWEVWPTGNAVYWGHEGSQPGSTGFLMVRPSERRAWVVLFNSQPQDWRSFINEAAAALRQAASEVTGWPAHDLFSQYP